MPKTPRPALDYVVYLAVRVVVCVVQAVPPAVGFAVADALAWLAYKVDRRHRRVAADNLRHAFPDRDAADIDRLVRGCYRHFVRLIVEIARLPRGLRVYNWWKHYRVSNGHLCMPHILADRSALFVTGHFGNWELAGYVFGAFGFRTYAIARVLDNPHLERFLKRFRQHTGQTVIAKKDDFARLTVALKAGGKVATLADQDAGPRGVFVDFFGRPASAHKAVALMALEFDAVMLVIGVPRVGVRGQGAGGSRIGPGPYAIHCEEVIDPREYAGRPDAVKAITQRYHAALERMIRRHPEQYFWLHRRWKTRPKGEKSAAAPTPLLPLPRTAPA